MKKEGRQGRKKKREERMKRNMVIREKRKRERKSLTNLEELLFLRVLAFPKDSRSGFDSRMISLMCWTLWLPLETLVM